jgi:hypothetical protein
MFVIRSKRCWPLALIFALSCSPRALESREAGLGVGVVSMIHQPNWGSKGSVNGVGSEALETYPTYVEEPHLIRRMTFRIYILYVSSANCTSRNSEIWNDPLSLKTTTTPKP